MEPGTKQVIEAKLKHGFEHNTGTPGIFEESRELRGKSEINLARSLVILTDGWTLVRVAIFSDRLIRLLADLPVAEYHPVISGNSRFVQLEPDQDSTSASRPSCSVIDRPGVREDQPKKNEKWRPELQSNLEGLSEDQTEQFLSLVTEYGDILRRTAPI